MPKPIPEELLQKAQQLYLADLTLSSAEIAREIGCSNSKINEWLKPIRPLDWQTELAKGNTRRREKRGEI